MGYGASKPSWAEPRRVRPRETPLKGVNPYGSQAFGQDPASESSAPTMANTDPAPSESQNMGLIPPGYTLVPVSALVEKTTTEDFRRPMTLMDVPATYFYAFMILVIVALWVVAAGVQRGCNCMCHYRPKIITTSDV